MSPRSNMRIPRAKIRLTAIFPLSWHPPLDIVRRERRNALTGPGSRRLGGVEATGASPGVAPSRPHRLGPPAPPGWCARCLTGGWGPGGGWGWGSDLARALTCALGPGVDMPWAIE